MNCSLECDIYEYTTCSVVLVEDIQVIRWTSAVIFSYDRIDLLHLRYSCWRHMTIMWPFSASIFRLNFLNFWMQQISLSRLSHDCSRIQIRKTPMIPDFCLSRQVRRYFNHQPAKVMHLSAFLENAASRQVSFVDALSTPGLFDAIG